MPAVSQPVCTAVPASCLSRRVRAARACWCTVCPARTPGSLASRMIRWIWWGRAEGFGVADGGDQDGLGGVLVSGPGEHFSGGDPLDDRSTQVCPWCSSEHRLPEGTTSGYGTLKARVAARAFIFLGAAPLPRDLSPHRLPAGADVVPELVCERRDDGQPAPVLVIVARRHAGRSTGPSRRRRPPAAPSPARCGPLR